MQHFPHGGAVQNRRYLHLGACGFEGRISHLILPTRNRGSLAFLFLKNHLFFDKQIQKVFYEVYFSFFLIQRAEYNNGLSSRGLLGGFGGCHQCLE